jgi:hypothetical protein
VRLKKRLNLTAQGFITIAGSGEEDQTLALLTLQSGVKQLINFFPAFWSHTSNN